MASRTQQLIILVTAKDMATRQLRGINKELGVLGRGLSPRGQMAAGAGKIAGGVFKTIEVAAVAAAGGIVLAAKAGMDFQDAMAGVQKTVEGTPKELAGIYEGLRALATRVPVKFEDLAGIAQQAGALGVPTKNILSFTEAVARVTAAGTGLDEAQVAETFGKLGTLFHLTGPQFSQMGSALVTLGNNAASSEGDIVKMALRFGGLGQAIGLSVPQVLAWSSAVASLGPLAEAGGSSLVRMFGRVVQYAGTGDKKFQAFAKAAGMSEVAFRKLVKSDTSAAMLKFVAGLKGMDKIQLAKTLKLAGITNVRDIQAIQALANNPKVLTDALAMANKAWKDNNALTEISNKRFDTLKAHWTEFTNIIRNALVDISEGLNPALDRALKRMSAVFLDPKMRTQLKQLGKDIGDAIDRIDWERAISTIRTLVGYAKQFVDVLMSLPPELLAGIGGAAIVNKASGGLLGAGVSDVIGGAIRTALGQIVGRGSPANPMWVTWRGMAPGGPGVPGGEPVPPVEPGGITVPAIGAGIAIDPGPLKAMASDFAHYARDQVAQGKNAEFTFKSIARESALSRGESARALSGALTALSGPLSRIPGIGPGIIGAINSLKPHIDAISINATVVRVAGVDGRTRVKVTHPHPGNRPPVRTTPRVGIEKNRGLAAGGPVWPGLSYTVGERGPETFVPSSAGMIVPHGRSGQAGASPIVIHMHAPSARDTTRADRSWRRYGNGKTVGIG